jgi:glucose/arabinose dehydrogenase
MRAGHGTKRLLTLALTTAALAAAAPAQAFMTLVPAWTNQASVTQPIFVTAAPGDPHRLFVVTKPGVIHVVLDGVLQATPFLDISSQVWSSANESGLLSIAFDPADTNRFYAYFVAPPSGGSQNGDIRIEEFTRTSANAADPVGRLVLEIPHDDAANHYGGTILFGPNDGLLYIAPGDGGGRDNEFGNAQNTKKSLLGKLLRIDPHQSGSAPYTIPPANPYPAQPRCDPPSGTTDCPEILATGLRNPFRWSFDRQTGDVAIGDVGQDQWEEVDYVPASTSLSGLNFGWPCFEGFAPNASCAPPPISHTPPVFAYADPPSGAVAITGGVVVRDPALTTLYGRYLYADVYAGRVRSLQLATPFATGDRLESDIPKVPNLVAFGEDADGHVYVVSLTGTGPLAGTVSRIVCSGVCSSAPATDPPVTDGGPAPAPDQSPAPEPSTNPAGALPPATRDSVPPALSVRAARVQNVVRRGRVRLSVAAGESAIVRISARARGLALRGALVRLAPGRRVVVELRASKRLRQLLAARGVVEVKLRARDSAGNLRVAALTVAVKR